MDMEQKYLVPVNDVADVLRRARALVDTPEKWCQFSLENDSGAMCAMGAISKAVTGRAVYFGPLDAGALNFFRGVIRGLCGVSVATWNNAPERTHADVLAAFTKAIELAEQPGA